MTTTFRPGSKPCMNQPSSNPSQPTAAGYVIGHITVKDERKWQAYCAQVPASLTPWGAEIVFRGKRHAVFAGSHPHMLTVVLRFPDVTAAAQWHASPTYQALVPLREQAADVTLLGFET